MEDNKEVKAELINVLQEISDIKEQLSELKHSLAIQFPGSPIFNYLKKNDRARKIQINC